MAIKIKISPKDELKIIKSDRKPMMARQVHKNKKAYVRQTKHQELEY